MTSRLSELRDCFEGVIPSVIATTDADGMPNISYLSHVHYVDEWHVALSNQFFSKTAANVRQWGIATLMVVDGRTGQQHMLDLKYSHSLTEGELFDRAASHLSVTSLSHGMGDVMKLRSLEIYEVAKIRPVVPAQSLADPEEPEPTNNRLDVARQLCEEIAQLADAEAILDRSLELIDSLFGYPNAVVLVPGEGGEKLITIASRGYPAFGFGSEVSLREGTIGMAAVLRRPLRICDMRRGQRYVSAIQAEALRAGAAEIPFPSLPQPRSQLALPLLGRSRLIGILFIESEQTFAFGHQDEIALAIVASQLATGLLLAEGDRPESGLPVATPTVPLPAKRIVVSYFPFDGSIFVDDEYVIRGLPGRLLHYFLSHFVKTGRFDFSNKEIRRDAALQLPDFKDNLETRLILLRRRLDERAGPIRLSRPARGQIRLECHGVPEIRLAVDRP